MAADADVAGTAVFEFDLAVAVRRRPCRVIDDRSRRQAGQEHRSGPFSAGHSAIVLVAVATAAMIDATLAAVAAAATGLAVGIVVAETSTDQALHKLVQTPRSPHDFGQESRADQDRVWGPRAGANSADSTSDAVSADDDHCTRSMSAWVSQMSMQIETADGAPRKLGQRSPSRALALRTQIAGTAHGNPRTRGQWGKSLAPPACTGCADKAVDLLPTPMQYETAREGP
jgi:hypothetical protein